MVICFGYFMIGEFHLSLHLIWGFFFFGFFKFFCRKVWSKGAVVRINCWVHHIQKFRCFEKNLKQVNRGVFHLSLEHLAWSTLRRSGQGPAVLDHVNYPHRCSWLDSFLLEVLLKARVTNNSLWVACLLQLEVLGQARTGANILSVAAC